MSTRPTLGLLTCFPSVQQAAGCQASELLIGSGVNDLISPNMKTYTSCRLLIIRSRVTMALLTVPIWGRSRTETEEYCQLGRSAKTVSGVWCGIHPEVDTWRSPGSRRRLP